MMNEMEILKNFFEDLFKDTTLIEKSAEVNVINHSHHIEIKIDYPTPEENRENKRSKGIIYILEKHYFPDDENKLVESLQKQRIVDHINKFDFHNYTLSNAVSRPIEKFSINLKNGKIEQID